MAPARVARGTRGKADPMVTNRTRQTEAQATSDAIAVPDGHDRTEHIHGQQTPAMTPRDSETSSAPTLAGNEAISAAIKVLGARVTELISFVNNLDHLNIQTLDLPLPKIVVIGEQSAGKSSLVEAISTIKVPRSTGTCTRCPLHINLSDRPDLPWSCRIYLDKEYAYTPESNGHTDLGPWTRLGTTQSTPLSQVHNVDDLESELKRAQYAILSPRKDPNTVTLSSTVEAEVKFSPNVIRLEIAGPDLLNLSFYDLPGVIAQTEDDEDDYLVTLVSRLNEMYVRKNDSIVLLALAMEGDPSNSKASRLVKECQAQGRCMGVLTKPDRLPQGESHKEWQTILNNSRFKMGYGYCVTKQPSQVELEQLITHDEARQKEREFFANSKPWNESFKIFADRFGTDNLRDKLRDLLVQKIQESLPRIDQQLNQRISEVHEELANMPEPPADDSLRVVYELLANFKNDMSRMLSGESINNEFHRRCRELIREMRSFLFAMRPGMKMEADGESWITQRSMSPAQAQIMVIPSDSDDERSQVLTPVNSRKRPSMMNPPSTPAKRVKGEGRQTPLARNELAKVFTLAEVRDVMHSTTSSDIPDNSNPKAVEELVKASCEHWQAPVTQFLSTLEQQITSKLLVTFGKIMERWSDTELYKQGAQLLKEFIEDACHQLKAEALKAVAYECEKQLTFNEDFYNTSQSTEFQLLKEARRKHRASEYLREQDVMNGKSTDKDLLHKRIETITTEKLGSDRWSKEIEVLSKVRAYYNVAYLRLVDRIAQAMHVELFKVCREKLYQFLVEGLEVSGPNGHANCLRLLAEDPERERRRATLFEERGKLLTAREEYSKLIKPVESELRSARPASYGEVI